MLLSVNPPINSCNITDKDCLTDVLNTALINAVAGYDEYGVEGSDPMFFDELIGVFTTGNYKYAANTVTGVKEWTLRNAT